MTRGSPFADYRATPLYSDVQLYNVQGAAVRPFEFNGWKPESLSWKRSAYIHAGLSAGTNFRYTGPQALEFLQGICVNSFANFPVGAAKHAIMCREDGLIGGHGVVKRSGDQDFTVFVAGHWPAYMHSRTELDVQQSVEDDFLFQIAGPRALEIVESACGEDLHDLRFLRFRNARIDGRTVEVMRVGMAGTLAYELHGSMDDAAPVYDTVYRAGQPYGIERLGWRTYTVNHIEGGFPQTIWTFIGAGATEPGMQQYLRDIGLDSYAKPIVSGSADPQDWRARMRTPFDVGWGGMVRFDHEFIGRRALEAEAGSRPRTIVTLEWNSDDVIDVYASLFRDGEEFKFMDMPTVPHMTRYLAHADRVLIDGREIGWASGAAYSYHYRRLISHATIATQDAREGDEVVVEWGDYGHRIKPVRAVIARYPYLEGPRNQTIDIDSIPPGVGVVTSGQAAR